MNRFSLWTPLTYSLILVLLALGCHEHDNRTPDWHRELLGRDYETVIRTLGPTQDSYDFTMADTLGESQVFLYNRYPPEASNAKDIVIREIHWQKEGFAEVIWLKKEAGSWTVIDGRVDRDGIVYQGNICEVFDHDSIAADNHDMHRSGGGQLPGLLASLSPPPGDV